MTFSYSDDIIKYINSSAQNIQKNDIDNIVSKLMEHYQTRINYLAFRVYGSSIDHESSIALRSFREVSKKELARGLSTFLFNSEHWKHGRDVNTYLLTCLNYLTERIKNDINNVKRVSAPICPCCKFLGNKEFLILEDKQYRCNSCSKELDRLLDEEKVNKLDLSTINNYQLYKIFALHSKKGFRCENCERFIPNSSVGILNKVSCPYSDCCFFGYSHDLEEMSHPTSLTLKTDVSLDQSYAKDDTNDNLYNKFKSDNIDADVQINAEEQFKIEFDTVKDVIEIQKERALSSGFKATSIQKSLMYQAYLNMLMKFPEEMISYLAHLKQCAADFPIQSTIFQEYVKLIKNKIPFEIKRGKDDIFICSLTDPNLKLFDEISIFEASVRNNFTIPNNTKETYLDYGSNFIGMIIDLKDKSTNVSIKNKIESYSFSEIKVSEDILPGTIIECTHYNLKSHYELGPLVSLQRTRKKIVDSVYLRLHGKKRK